MNTQDKKDLKKIFQDTLMEFWDKALEPAFNKILGRLDGVEGRLSKVEQKAISVDQRTQSMDKHLEAIEKTLEGKADDILVTRVEGNILTRIDKMEKNIGKGVSKQAEKVKDHEKRITRIEKTTPLTP